MDPKASSIAESYARAFEQADVVLRGVSEGVTVHDRNGRLVYVNDAAARLGGFDNAAAMLATPQVEFTARFEMTTEDGAVVRQDQWPGHRALAGEPLEPLLVRVRDRATGRTWWIEIRASTLADVDGRAALAVNLMHDVTAQQRTKEAARVLTAASKRLSASIEYESTLASVAESLVPAIADWSSVDLMEAGVRRSLAVAHADPTKIAFARELNERYPPDPNATTGVANVLRTGKPELYPEIPEAMLRASAVDDEHWRMISELGLRSAMCVPIVVSGRTEGALTLIAAESGRLYDETDLALASEIGRRAGTAIEHARAYLAAQRAIRARDEFLSVAGHELRTPLAALSLQLENLKSAFHSGRVEADPAKYAARVEKAIGQTARLGKLVEELLDVSRVSSGRLGLARTTVDLSAIVREVTAGLSEVASRAGVTMELDAPDVILGRWDPHRLEQVVSNLLANAIKYGEGKPVQIRCEPRDDDTAAITVHDDGIGIPPEHQQRIFDRFERAVSEHNYGGLGLGLWIVREIVEAHGGRVSVRSEPGSGTTFEAVLPRDRS